MANYNAEVLVPPGIIEALKDARPAEIMNQPAQTSVPQVIAPGTRVIRR